MLTRNRFLNQWELIKYEVLEVDHMF